MCVQCTVGNEQRYDCLVVRNFPGIVHHVSIMRCQIRATVNQKLDDTVVTPQARMKYRAPFVAVIVVDPPRFPFHDSLYCIEVAVRSRFVNRAGFRHGLLS